MCVAVCAPRGWALNQPRPGVRVHGKTSLRDLHARGVLTRTLKASRVPPNGAETPNDIADISNFPEVQQHAVFNSLVSELAMHGMRPSAGPHWRRANSLAYQWRYREAFAILLGNLEL